MMFPYARENALVCCVFWFFSFLRIMRIGWLLIASVVTQPVLLREGEHD